jgi:hypothetical protein
MFFIKKVINFWNYCNIYNKGDILTMYISSRNLKIDPLSNVKRLDTSLIHKVKNNDILLFTATLRDDLILRSLLERNILPFIITFTESSTVSTLLENLTLLINKEINIVTIDIIKIIKNIRDSIRVFENYIETSINKEETVKELQILNLYQQVLFCSFQGREGFKSPREKFNFLEHPRRDIYFDIKKNRQRKISYIILYSTQLFRIFKIEEEIDEHAEKFIYNMFNMHFEALMRGEKIKLKNRKFSFEYQEITQGYKTDFLLFSIEDKNSFSSYSLYTKNPSKTFKNMALYEINKEVKDIDKQGELALHSLRSILKHSKAFNKEQEILYKNLDIFLFSARNFKSIISTIAFNEQKSFKQTIISDMFDKIYANITEKRELSQLRFALVLLFSKEFDGLGKRIHSHVFYDIHNGININSQLLKAHGIETSQEEPSKDSIYNEYLEEEREENFLNDFIKNSDEKKFIQVFLNSILAMKSTSSIDLQKSIKFVAFFSYISSTNRLNVSHKEGFEKIQISYCYIIMVEFHSEFNRNMFFLYLDDFVNLEDKEIEIKLFLEDKIVHKCDKSHKEVNIIIWKTKFTKSKDNLRQINHKFSKKLLTIGLFYKLLSEQESSEEIISTSLKKIRNREINIQTLCTNKITFNFLALFFQGHGKKNCTSNLEAFLEQSHLLLNKK